MLVYTPTFLALQMAALTLLRARIDTESDPNASVKLLSRRKVQKLEYLRTTPSFLIAAHCNQLATMARWACFKMTILSFLSITLLVMCCICYCSKTWLDKCFVRPEIAAAGYLHHGQVL